MLLISPTLFQLIEHPVLSCIQLAHHQLKLLGREWAWRIVARHMTSEDHP
ncbi:hypothetical protein CFBP6411_04389 [Pseudomonas syringae group genomosp. 3]|uniref:Uncharacterized protein n=1 Tax=Pseudomonas syringae group genomosp. 3 TaxID=251701 RepID=A0A2K4WIL5_9PSED|nr:hypothetical protein CFBP6411_04389 [Pseudomonas syringae group genomosp. 3]